MARGKVWSHDELVIAMNLYCRLPFGTLHQQNPQIVEVAGRLGRTPGSVAMKLCNLASLDPAQQARGVSGLAHASAGDRAVWEEFHLNWDEMAIRSETAMASLLGEHEPTAPERDGVSEFDGFGAVADTLPKHYGLTTAERLVQTRRGQGFFRRTVLASYSNRCAVTGNPVPELLVASHILPWSEFPDERLNPRNGICLAAHFDRAFDRGLATFDEDMRLILSPRLSQYVPDRALETEFLSREGDHLRTADRFLPSTAFLDYHREKVFH
ncbi:HNH endonuclease [bacterium]|nr:HNH endonuclease [bacterium]